MRRLWPVALLLCACGGPVTLPDSGVRLSVHVPTTAVDSGRAFPLTVVRAWSKDLLPAHWDASALSPLVLAPAGYSRREDDGAIEETRRFSAYAFARTDAAVPALEFRARPRAGGPERSARSEPIALQVAPALPAGAPGAPELPGGLLLPPRSGLPWPAVVLLLALGAGIGIFLLRARPRRTPAEPPAVPTGPSPRERALLRLQDLHARTVGTRSEIEAFHVEAAALLRDYLHGQFGLPAPEMTSEELCQDQRTARVLSPDLGDLLEDVLRRCDHVKFAREQPGAPERDRLVADTASLVRATGPGGGNGRP